MLLISNIGKQGCSSANVAGSPLIDQTSEDSPPPCWSPSHLLASSDEGTCCEKPICDLDVRQKADRAERPDGLSASNCGRNKSYRILLGLVELRVGRQGLLLDSNCS